MLIKLMNASKNNIATVVPPPAPPTKSELLLTEIRDLLKEKKD